MSGQVAVQDVHIQSNFQQDVIGSASSIFLPQLAHNPASIPQAYILLYNIHKYPKKEKKRKEKVINPYRDTYLKGR